MKEELGLAHFEGRSWRGFHHHVCLVMMAYGFLALEQRRAKDDPAKPGKKGIPSRRSPCRRSAAVAAFTEPAGAAGLFVLPPMCLSLESKDRSSDGVVGGLVMDLWGPLRRVLQSIQDLQGDSPDFLRDSAIAMKIRMPLKNVQYCLGVLAENEFISLTRQTEGYVASVEAKGRLALTIPSGVPLITFSTNRVVPKGLRSFDANDSTFFLDLLPGTRTQYGLPESISYWKDRIEERDPDKSFRVGVIYGPSGCGKTSLVEAGLVPNLADDILVISVKASPDETESLLLKHLLKQCPGIVGEGLPQAISVLSKGSGLPEGKTKILLVVDQYEQWLHAHRSGGGGELADSLKNCDGVRLQAIVMVRDDFWMALTRFMAEIGVEMRQDLNCAAIDLFGERHARRVLTLFGQAFGALPEDPEEISDEQREFLDGAIAGLSDREGDGKIAPVRLALFAQMLSEKEWSPSTLQEVGGAEGVGVAFLEDTFETERGRRRYQFSQADLGLCRCILKALLPDFGTGIKGGMKIEEELLKKSGYGGDENQSRRVLRILDGETRLITPTDAEEVGGDSSPGRSGPTFRYYQLTHDYLVPSIREWLTRKQKETRRGRAEILLADRSSLWKAKKEDRFLPSPWEWANIRMLTKTRDWTEPQRGMMDRAGRMHRRRGIALLLLLVVGTIMGLGIRRRLSEERNASDATGFVQSLLDAETAEVPDILSAMRRYHPWADSLLRKAYSEPDDDPRDPPNLRLSQKLARQAEVSAAGLVNAERGRILSENLKMRRDRRQLHASLALLSVDPTQVSYLYGRLLDAQPQQLSVIIKILDDSGHGRGLRDRLWSVVERPGKGQEVQRLRAACALAKYDPENKRWDQFGAAVVEQLVSVNPFDLAGWTEALQPIKYKLVEPLKAVFLDRTPARNDQRSLATSILANYYANDLVLLGKLLVDADEKQFSVLFPLLERQGAISSIVGKHTHSAADAIVLTMPVRMELPGLKAVPIPEVSEAQRETEAKRMARAAIALLRLGQGEQAWTLLRHSPDPSVRSFIVNWLKPLGAEPNTLRDRLDCLAHQPVSIPNGGKNRMDAILFDPVTSEHRALILALGEYDAEFLTPTDRAPLVEQLLETYRNDHDAGIHGASEWTLRRWKQEEALKKVDAELRKTTDWGDRRWFVNSQGQTFAVIEGPVEFSMGSPPSESDRSNDETLHRQRIKRSFAIVTKEVTLGQYREYLEQNPKVAPSETKYSSEPTGPKSLLTWYEAAAYCNWLSEREHLKPCYEPNLAGEYAVGMRMVPDFLDRSGYRLPTEAEWEYACRSGTITSHPHGGSLELLGKYAWYSQNSAQRAGPCGRLKPNDLGLFDMMGNVFEWCQDEYRPDSPEVDNGEETAGDLIVKDKTPRILRGGAFSYLPSDVRSAYRNNYQPSYRIVIDGFRQCRTLP